MGIEELPFSGVAGSSFTLRGRFAIEVVHNIMKRTFCFFHANSQVRFYQPSQKFSKAEDTTNVNQTEQNANQHKSMQTRKDTAFIEWYSRALSIFINTYWPWRCSTIAPLLICIRNPMVSFEIGTTNKNKSSSHVDVHSRGPTSTMATRIQ